MPAKRQVESIFVSLNDARKLGIKKEAHLLRKKFMGLLAWMMTGVVFCLCLALYAMWHLVTTAQAQPAPIYAKSEMTKEQIKEINHLQIMTARPERIR